MTAAFSVLARRLGSTLRMHVKLAEAEEDDLRAPIEPDFDKRIIARHRCHYGMDASCLADPLPVRVSKIVRLRMHMPHRNRLADENARARCGTGRIGGRGFVRAHRTGFESDTSDHLERKRDRMRLSQR